MRTLNTAFPEFSQQTALVRVNFDVPIENGQVQDTTRIEDAVATIKFLRSQNCQVILAAHAGRPDGTYNQQDSLRPIIPILEPLVGEKIQLIDYQVDYTQLVLPSSPLVLLENLRFWPQEETNDDNFARYISSLAKFYVNESFAVCHRSHASIVGFPKYLPSFFGLSLEKEYNVLSKVRTNPDRPLVVVIGGAKLETKMPLVNAFAPIADTILVGGKIAIELKEQVVPANVDVAELTTDQKDITPEAAKRFADKILSAKTVIWNGTMGVFEEPAHELGTKVIAEAMNQTSAFTVMGGGDTETALTKFHLESGINHISSGGGAMLTLFSEGKLVGIDALLSQN